MRHANRARPVLRYTLAGLMALSACAASAQQAYPAKVVRVIVPYVPGGAGDIMGRLIGQKMSASWGQQVIVDNRPGAAGMIGAAIAAKAPPDGHTLLLGYTSEIAINPTLYSRMTYDPAKELISVAMAGVLPLLLVTNPSLPVKSVRDLIALARSRPGDMTYGSAGNGTPAHLGMEYLKRTASIDIVHVPYKGGAEVVAAILGGHVMTFFSGIPPAIPHVKIGRLRAIAVSTAKRASMLPDVPTVSESGGIRGFDIAAWFGYFAPAGTPNDVIAKVNATVNASLRDPDIARQFDQQGIVISPMSPEQFASFIAADTRKYAQLVKQSGARAN